jgi:hypothetical protein
MFIPECMGQFTKHLKNTQTKFARLKLYDYQESGLNQQGASPSHHSSIIAWRLT